MSLGDVITDVENRRKTLTVFNPGPDDTLYRDLEEYFDTQNVEVRSETTESGRPEGIAVLSQGDAHLTSTSTDVLRDLTDETHPGDGGLGIDDAAHADVLRFLEETTFASYSPEQMLAASREIEDRAWRVGAGCLHAGFQNVSTLDGTANVYRDLAERPLDVHAYATPDRRPPTLPGVTVYLEETEEIERSWFVVFDGAGEDEQKCALLAEEREEGAFYGFWTYDPAVVDRILDNLTTRYGGGSS
ncbi:DICT sensory domain-containing protein [Halostella pelagica]|uniref:DICT sensory domain-containing protein n=1 Tax=Halostella pelagica TaxID=2583824 RepID=UPI0010811ABA|nr:DICT sensory domain-containing protein [Halostella pelagica]